MKKNRLLATLIAASILGVGVEASHAANGTWTGGGTDTDWTTSGNWLGGTIPGTSTVTGNIDYATFTPNAGAPITVTFGELNLRRFEIGSGPAAISYTGTTLHLTGSTAGSTIARIYRVATSTPPKGNYSTTFSGNIVLESSSSSGLHLFSLDNRVPNGSATESTSNAMVINGNISGGTTTNALELQLQGATGDRNAVNGIISDGGAASVRVLKGNNGLWELNGANTYTGGTTISGGTLRTNHNTALGTGMLTITGGALSNGSGGAITYTNNNAMAWNANFNLQNLASADFNLGTGAVTLGATVNLRMQSTVGKVIVGGDISGGDNEGNIFGINRITDEGTLVLNGTRSYYGNTESRRGTLVLAGAYLNSGNTVVGGEAGTARLHINHAQALGSGKLIFQSTGTLTLDSSGATAMTVTTNNEQIWNGNFTFGGTQDLNLGTGAVSLGTAAGTVRTVSVTAKTLTVGGAISDGTNATTPTIALTKTGAGTLRLSGANTYSGTTTVSAGTLLVDGTHTNGGDYVVASGATFGGSGTIQAASLSLAAGAKLSPGDGAPGTLSLNIGPNTLDLSNLIAATHSQSLLFTLGGEASDRVLLSNPFSTLDIGSAGKLELDDFAFSFAPGFTAGQYVLFQTGQLISGELGANLTGMINGYHMTLSLSENERNLILTAVPEPGGFALAGLGLLALGGWRLRRRRK